MEGQEGSGSKPAAQCFTCNSKYLSDVLRTIYVQGQDLECSSRKRKGGSGWEVPIRQLYTIGERWRTGRQDTSMRFDGSVSVSWSYSTFMDAWPASPMRRPSCCSIG